MKLSSLKKCTVSLLLMISILTTTLYGCGNNHASLPEDNTDIEIDTNEIVEEVSKNIIKEFSTEWEDYSGDIETFVYGLITNELGYKYNVFPGYIDLGDGYTAYGIAYTDFEEGYVNEDETKAAFLAGFMPYFGELEVPEDVFNEGVEIYNLDDPVDEYSFIYAYESEPFEEHCVVYGQYVKYGIDEDGSIFIESENYVDGQCDESLGSLYSYDDEKYLYDDEMGEFVAVTGKSLSTQIDYEELEKEINNILETQDKNFVDADIKTSAYYAQEAVNSYLLSLQEETFLGYDVDLLIEEVNKLDPVECYRLTSNGPMVIDKSSSSSLAKWIVGSACTVAFAAGIVGSIVFVECPALSSVAGAVAGTSIEIFMQVVIAEESLSNINWTKVSIAAVSGAASGLLGPYVIAKYSGAAYFIIDSALDGLIGGVEQTVFAWMDGKDGADMVKAFGFGFALGFGISASFKAVGKVVEAVSNRIVKSTGILNGKMYAHLKKKTSALAGKTIYKWKSMADESVFHSKYIQEMITIRQLDNLVSQGSTELERNSFKALQKDGIMDVNGNPISKNELRSIFKTAEDNSIIGKYEIDGEIINIVKKNSMVGIVFDPKYQTVEVPVNYNHGQQASRTENMEAAVRKFKESWVNDPGKMPSEIKNVMDSRGIEIEDIDTATLMEIIRDSRTGWVLHENIDKYSISLVPRWLHDKAAGGISHMGGFGLAKYLKHHMGKEFFDRFLASASSAATHVAN